MAKLPQVCAPTVDGLRVAAARTLGIQFEDPRAATGKTASTLSAADAATVAAARQVWTLGWIYDDMDFGGSSYGFTINNVNACGQAPVYVNNLSAYGWDNRASAMKGNVCKMVLFENPTYTGLSYGPYWSSNWVGANFNDKASSIRFQN
ncbi:hypothetical protein HQQ81_01570 [Microbacteriaceae bacterium VKM Ac-2854]|nr:hypothetical protein [Microbacteriaceae bacterium VKM Ac-2854]